MADPLMISAIICTHNRDQYLDAAIDSLLTQTISAYEVIVVDNASTDRTAEIVQSKIAKVQLKKAQPETGTSTKDSDEATCSSCPTLRYLYEETLGLSVARNTGAAAANGQILAYLDDDAEASQGWLSSLIEVFKANERVAIAGGKVTLIWPPTATPPAWLSDDLSSSLGAYNLGDERLYIQRPELTPRGLNYAVRKTFLTAVGGFDTHLGRVGKNLLSNEEQQMTRLALADGWQVAYEPKALVAHNVAPARMKPRWFLSRSWWQGISESYREQASGTTGLWQLRCGSERLIRGLYKACKYIHRPKQRFENFTYAYGQIAYLGSVVGYLLRFRKPI
ncbi:MAG: glycosyltransferase [Cyanobacteria bacterium P01_D01_bin.105]